MWVGVGAKLSLKAIYLGPRLHLIKLMFTSNFRYDEIVDGASRVALESMRIF